MAWEQVKKQSRKGMKPGIWYEAPCVTVCKTCISLNQKAVDAFGLTNGDSLLVLIDKDRGAFAFRKATNGEQDGFKLTAKSGNAYASANSIACKTVSRVFPDRVGDTFRARFNHEEQVIEVSLNGERA